MQVPIIAPIKPKKAEMLEQQPLKTHYSNDFLSGLMNNPDLVRNVAVVGHLHHGKTLVSRLHGTHAYFVSLFLSCWYAYMMLSAALLMAFGWLLSIWYVPCST